MACTVADAAAAMERLAPLALAEDDDNIGLISGVSSRRIDCVLISLDVTAAVIESARQSGAGLIVAHHPIIYRRISSVSDATAEGRLLIDALEAGIAVYAAHTNLDRALGGVNDAFCEAVGLAHAAPAQEGSIERFATLDAAVSLQEFALKVKAGLSAPFLRVTGDSARPVRRVCVLSGSSLHRIRSAAAFGADCLLTGEIGYHDALEADALGLAVIEAGHYHTERPVLAKIEKHLQSEFKRLQYTVQTAVYGQSTCPFRIIV